MELNKIILGDCFRVMKDIPDGSIDLIVTDPPYVVTRQHDGGKMFTEKKLDDYYTHLENANLCTGYDIKQFANEVMRLQGGKVNAYIWCNKAQIPVYFDMYVGKFGCKFEIICWHKQNALPTFSNKYLTDTEYCLYFHTGGFTRPKCYEDARTYEVSYINHADKKRWKHPTIKPVGLMQRFIRNSSKEGDTVLDPFIGSGTTAVACIRENRNYIGIENNEEYFKTACERVKLEQQKLRLF